MQIKWPNVYSKPTRLLSNCTSPVHRLGIGIDWFPSTRFISTSYYVRFTAELEILVSISFCTPNHHKTLSQSTPFQNVTQTPHVCGCMRIASTTTIRSANCQLANVSSLIIQSKWIIHYPFILLIFNPLSMYIAKCFHTHLETIYFFPAPPLFSVQILETLRLITLWKTFILKTN